MNAHLTRLNGRIGACETKLAVMEDRQSDARQEANDAGRKSAIKWASVISALLAGGEVVWRSLRQ